jgi:hypothetical protein
MRVNIRNPQCQHILIGARHSPVYTTIFQTNPSSNDRVSFIQGDTVDNEFMKMNLNYVRFSQVFTAANDGRDASKSLSSGAPNTLPSGVCKYHYQNVSLMVTCPCILRNRADLDCRGGAHERVAGMNTPTRHAPL